MQPGKVLPEHYKPPDGDISEDQNQRPFKSIKTHQSGPPDPPTNICADLILISSNLRANSVLAWHKFVVIEKALVIVVRYLNKISRALT